MSKSKPPPPGPWPRLSETLLQERHPDRCQACGADARLGAKLTRWQEHDQDDRPEPLVVVLCPPCSARLIEPHPRLYRELHAWEPMPGSMPICGACGWRDATRGAHPDAKANGGQGVRLTFPKPTPYFWHGRAGPKGGRRTGGRGVMYHGPVSSCAGRHVPVTSPIDPPAEEAPDGTPNP
jgi:hypothetical protein